MVGRKKEVKKCVVCGKKINGTKDYCAECHAKILEKMRSLRRERRNYYKAIDI